MSKRQSWRRILDVEMQKWSSMSYDELVHRLQELQDYRVKGEPHDYQVEVQLLEKTQEYVHVMVAVDDGTLPQSLVPVSDSFICRRVGSSTPDGGAGHGPDDLSKPR